MAFRSELSLYKSFEIYSERSIVFAEYWASLPKIDLIPKRQDFEPKMQISILPTFAIHELEAPDQITIRLAGTTVVERYGEEITSKNYLRVVEESRRQAASRAIFAVCEKPCGMLVRLATKTKSGLVRMNESLALPMRNNDGIANLVYYQSNSEPMGPIYDAQEDQLNLIEVNDRKFIDIGAGVPNLSD